MRVNISLPKSARGRRVLASVIILAAALSASAYLVIAPMSAKKNEAVAPLGDVSLGNISQNLNFIREAPNLTNEFTDQALQKLMAQNGSVKANGVTSTKAVQLLPGKPDISTIVSKIIDDELAAEQIKTSDLKVNTSDATSTQLLYLIFIDQTLRTEGREMPDPTTSSLTTYFSATAAKLNETAEILKAVHVPPSWISIHRDLVAFFLRQANIYLSLGAANTDPLRFMIATTRLVPTETEKEFQKIQAAINQKIADEKLI